MDFLKAGLVYVPTYLIGGIVAQWLHADAVGMFLAGWLSCGVATAMRYEGPRWIRREYR